MGLFSEFQGAVQAEAPLASLTWFRLGGPAEWLARPRDPEELAQILARARDAGLPAKVLGGGSNVLVRDDGVRGLIIHLESPAFSDVKVEGGRIEAGAAVPLTALISQAARAGLGGLEVLTGIPGTIGGAVRGNAGGRQGSIGQFVVDVTAIGPTGDLVRRSQDDLSFGYRWSNLDDSLILGVGLALPSEDPEAVVRRMRRVWIVKKENQPYGHQSAGCIFKDPAPDVTARAVLEAAGVRGMQLRGVEVSDRHPNYMIAHPGATASELLALIEAVRDRVRETSGHELELQIQVW